MNVVACFCETSLKRFHLNIYVKYCTFPMIAHPKLAKELRACPFNARHLIPKQELAQHIEMCENRRSPEECEIDHADDHVAPFVWGVTPQMNNQPVNNLPQGLRAPNALPWESFKQ
uniref:CHHC U11-48K-type domain-containing protein n=1 Tax=Oryzias melastigma TaxID=30732 RepID=A0A3B3DHC5_ORYME